MLALFGFFTCVALEAPWYAYVIGLFCLILDARKRNIYLIRKG